MSELSSIDNYKEVEGYIQTCISNYLDDLHDLDLARLRSILKGITSKNQKVVPKDFINNMDRPEARTWSTPLKDITANDYKGAKIKKHDVYLTVPEITRLAEYILSIGYAKQFGAKDTRDIAFDFCQQKFMCARIAKISLTTLNAIVLRLVKAELKEAIKEKTEYETYLKLKDKYEPANT